MGKALQKNYSVSFRTGIKAKEFRSNRWIGGYENDNAGAFRDNVRFKILKKGGLLSRFGLSSKIERGSENALR